MTNFHVIAPHLADQQQIIAFSENGAHFPVTLIAHSPENEFDFAILQTVVDVPLERKILQPATLQQVVRGSRIIFAGFPHGIPDLLVHEAVVSGPAQPKGFYVDGSVNGGNSGGPIIDATSGQVVGIVTQRRFMGGAQLHELRVHVAQLSQHCHGIAGSGSVIIMGVDFARFAQLMAGGFSVIDQLIQMNANSGIGIGFHISHVDAEYQRLNLP